jgi:hypothetical protein
MTVKFWLKGGNVIVLTNIKDVTCRRNTNDDEFTSLSWTYDDNHGLHDPTLVGVCLREVQAVTSEDRW